MNELKEKYPKSMFEPNHSCRFCGGKGETYKKSVHGSPCICIFIQPDYVDDVAKMLGSTAKRMLKEIRENT